MLSFATDETEDYVHIISPVVGESGKTILNDALFISIYVQSENSLFLSLKKETPVFIFEEEEMVEDNIDLMMLVPALSSEEIVEEVEEKVSLDEVFEEEPLTQDVIVSAYQIAEADLEIITADLIIAQTAVEKIPSVLDDSSAEYNPTYMLSEEELESTEYLEAVTGLYTEAVTDFVKWEGTYNDLFEKDVFEQQEMVVDPSFPYYEYAVSDIEPGTYKLLITDLEGKVIEELEFEVVTEEVIADKIIENVNIFDNLIDSEVFE
jgi:uncharacterized protein YaiI (UPF0178 family)